MTNYLVFEGKNVEKALELAGKELSQDIASIKYDIVSYGSSGIFGIVGVKKAKIKVRVEHAPDSSAHREARVEARSLVQDTFHSPEITEAAADDLVAVESTSADLAKVVEIGTQALGKIINEITEDTRITVETRADQLLFKIEGGNSAVLIGKRGQTLDAIQYLVEKIVNKQTSARIRVLVDVKGYLGTRKAGLKKLAVRLAEKVQKSNKPVTVGQMNAYDRRIVHITLKDNPEVRTQSMGEGYYRKLVIFPKKRKSGRKNQAPAE